MACRPPGSTPLLGSPVWDLANRYLACLCEQLAVTIGGSPCKCCVYPGAFPPPADFCDSSCDGGNGVAIVQFTSRQATPLRVPGQDPSPCAQELQTTLTATVYRCGATVDDMGRFPSCADLSSDAAVLVDDEQAMRMAACCLSDSAIAGVWQPAPILGGCIGGTLSLVIPETACL